MKNVWKISIIESERGWGSKIDDYMICLSREDSMKFIKEFNSKNKSNIVPDWYMVASGNPINFQITDKQYDQLLVHGRMWLSQLKKHK